jgi:hypothetical protein
VQCEGEARSSWIAVYSLDETGNAANYEYHSWGDSMQQREELALETYPRDSTDRHGRTAERDSPKLLRMSPVGALRCQPQAKLERLTSHPPQSRLWRHAIFQ